jgi:hypothetical protein
MAGIRDDNRSFGQIINERNIMWLSGGIITDM